MRIDSKTFQSTHPHGVRLDSHNLISQRGEVSIHAPTWGATNEYVTVTRVGKFQSTHPHGVRLIQNKTIFRQIVSIHAPTWGATAAIQ